MKTLQTVALLSALAVSASATPLVFTDPYGQGSPDVIGDTTKFDIQSLTFDSVAAGNLSISIRLNYNGGDTTLSSFSVGAPFSNLNIGDILFSVGGVYTYAAILHGHDGLATGGLYKLTNGAETAQQALGLVGQPQYDSEYRPNAYVWAVANGATLLGSVGTVSTASIGTPEIKVTFNVAPAANSPFLADFAKSSFTFASADCGNDVIGGTITPEPSTMAIMGAGLASLAFFRRRKSNN